MCGLPISPLMLNMGKTFTLAATLVSSLTWIPSTIWGSKLIKVK